MSARPKSVALLTRQEIEALPEYSFTNPTFHWDAGRLVGTRRWRRRAGESQGWVLVEVDLADSAPGRGVTLKRWPIVEAL
jgi:hypothetical protein